MDRVGEQIDVATAFAGVLVFDVLCLCAARKMFSDVGATRDSPVQFQKVQLGGWEIAGRLHSERMRGIERTTLGN